MYMKSAGDSAHRVVLRFSAMPLLSHSRNADASRTQERRIYMTQFQIGGRPKMDEGDKRQIAEMVEKARLLLARILSADAQPGDESQAVQDLGEIVSDLRRFYPPQTFQKS